MAVTVRPGNKVVFVGDSITLAAWYAVTGGLVDQINAQIPTVVAPRYATLAGGARAATLAPAAVAATVAPVSIQSPIRVVNSGVSGDETANIDAAVAARITDYNPDVIVLLVGVNDVNLLESTAFITTHYGSILSQIRAWSPTVPIACLSILFIGELWGAGPVWANAKDTALNDANTAIQGLCATYNATYIDARARALTYETVNNAPAPGAASGILTSDGIHPNATGKLQLGDWTIGSFTVTP